MMECRDEEREEGGGGGGVGGEGWGGWRGGSGSLKKESSVGCVLHPSVEWGVESESGLVGGNCCLDGSPL